IGIQTKLLDELDVGLLGVAVCADQRNGCCGRAWEAGLQSKLPDCLVDCVFGHSPVGGPFAASDGHQSRWLNHDNVVSDKLLCGCGLWIPDQRPQSRPCCKHIAVSNTHCWSKISAGLGSKKANVLAGGSWIEADFAWRV